MQPVQVELGDKDGEPVGRSGDTGGGPVARQGQDLERCSHERQHLHAPAFKLRHDKPRPRHCRIVRSAEASWAASLSTDDPQGRKHNLWKQSVDRGEEHAALGGGGPGGAAAACGEMDCVAHVEDLQPVVPSIGHDELASVYRQPARVIQLAGRHAVPSPAAHQGAAGVSIHLDDAVHAGVGEEEGAAVGSNGQAVPAGGRGGKVDQAGRRLERAWRRHAQGRTGGKGTRRLGC
mmetsp:Transcript_8445/g.27171  ORF Transcript_8445/g.27171 Transcript_8445/m.27171 type:complete len:234 (+) Transcript_8445:230-931(+)